jgi:hypothetical protein
MSNRNTDDILTLAYLANELRKAHETATMQHQVIGQLKADLERAKKAQPAASAAADEGVPTT